MSITGIEGVTAAGRQPVWIIDAASLTGITDATTELPLATVTGGQRADCYYNFGGFTMTRTPNLRETQRACQKVAVSKKVGETIEGSMTIVYDQQALPTEEVNLAYSAMPEEGEVGLFVANGWDAEATPDATTKGDLWVVDVTQVDHLLAANADEDLMAQVTLNGERYLPNITLSGV